MRLGVRLACVALVIVIAAWIGTNVVLDGDPDLPSLVEPKAIPKSPSAGPASKSRAPDRPTTAREIVAGDDDAVDLSGKVTRNHMLRGAAVSGTVTDSNGSPISGARISAFRRFRKRSRPELILAVTTDERGAYRLGPIETEMLLEASAAGYHRVRVIALPQEKHDFRLGLAGALTGRVKHERDDVPCVDAIVAVFGPAQRVEHGAGSGPTVARAEAKTDRDGIYRFSDLAPGQYVFKVYPRDGKCFSPNALARVDAGETAQQDMVAPFTNSTVMRGTVTDRNTGRPINGATVFTRENDHHFAVTNAAGGFEIRGIAGSHTVCAEAAGYKIGYHGVQATPPLDIRRDFALEPNVSLSGRVLDPEGRPVENAGIAFRPEHAIEHNWKCAARTDAEGRFSLDVPPPRTGFYLYAAAAGLAPAASDWLEVKPGEVETGIDIRLSRGGVLAGRILSADGAPADGTELVLSSARRGFSRKSGWNLRATARNGTYGFTPAPAGRYRIRAQNPDEKLGEIELADGARKSLDLHLTQAARTLAIEGTIQTADGRPVVGAPLLVRSDTSAPSVIRACSDDGGRFRITGLTVGAYLISLESARHEPAWLCARAGDRGVVVTAVRKPTVVIRVVRVGTREPVEHFWVAGSTLTDRQQMTASNGRFELSASRFQRRGFTIGTEDGWITPAPVIVPENKTTGGAVLEVGLVRGGAVVGRVVGPEGSAICDARTRLLYAEAAATQTQCEALTRSDASGRFAIRPYPPGRHRLQVSHPDWISAKITIDVVANLTTKPLIRLGRGGTLVVRVVSPTGEPVGSAILEIEPASGESSLMSTGDSGERRLSGVTPGDCKVRAKHGDWAPAQATVTVLPGVDTKLTLRLGTGGTVKVTVVDSRNHPVAGASVAVKDANGRAVAFRAGADSRDYIRQRATRPKLTFEAYRRELALSDKNGVAVRGNIPAGKATVEIVKDGYQPVCVEVVVAAGRPTSVPVTLKPAP